MDLIVFNDLYMSGLNENFHLVYKSFHETVSFKNCAAFQVLINKMHKLLLFRQTDVSKLDLQKYV